MKFHSLWGKLLLWNSVKLIENYIVLLVAQNCLLGDRLFKQKISLNGFQTASFPIIWMSLKKLIGLGPDMQILLFWKSELISNYSLNSNSKKNKNDDYSRML